MVPQVASGQTSVPTHSRSACPGSGRRGLEGHHHGRATLGPSIQFALWPTAQEPGPSQNPALQKLRIAEKGMRSSQKAFISVRDKDFLRRYYEKIFQNLQQINCRILAKAYVKLVEPRKQVNFPYNGRKIVAGQTQQLNPDGTKPPWWPTGVSHREPDHLPKAGKELAVLLFPPLFCLLVFTHMNLWQRSSSRT